MKLILLIAGVSLLPTLSFGAPTPSIRLTPECKAKLEAETLAQENKRMLRAGEIPASELIAETRVSYWHLKDGVNIGVHIEEPLEGRSIIYSAKVTPEQALACEIPSLSRRHALSCRYSRHEGPDSMTEIPGVSWVNGKSIEAGEAVSDLEKVQIQAFLAEGDPDADINELIDSTDDKEVTTGLLTLPNGQELLYMGAYGGDNPHGVFFEQGSSLVKGSNSDGSICINE